MQMTVIVNNIISLCVLANVNNRRHSYSVPFLYVCFPEKHDFIKYVLLWKIKHGFTANKKNEIVKLK